MHELLSTCVLSRWRIPILTLADQLIFSLGNFVAIALLARALGIAGFATFSAGWLLIILAQNLQQAALNTPALLASRQFSNFRRERFEFVVHELALVLSFLLSLVLTLIFAAWITAINGTGIDIGVLGAFAISILGVTAHDFVRRHSLIGGSLILALAIDVVRSSVLIIICAWPSVVSSPSGAFTAVSVSSFLSVAVGLRHFQIVVVRRSFRAVVIGRMRLHAWHLGGMALLEFVSGNLPYLLLSHYSARDFGGVRALAALGTALSNFPRAADNMLPALYSRYLSEGQQLRVVKIFKNFLIFGVLIHAFFLVPAIFLQKEITFIVFGEEYIPYSSAIVFVLLVSLELFVFSSIKNVLISTSGSEFLLWSRLICLFVSGVLSAFLIPWFGVSGMFGALLLSDLSAIIYSSVHAHRRISAFAKPTR